MSENIASNSILYNDSMKKLKISQANLRAKLNPIHIQCLIDMYKMKRIYYTNILETVNKLFYKYNLK